MGGQSDWDRLWDRRWFDREGLWFCDGYVPIGWDVVGGNHHPRTPGWAGAGRASPARWRGPRDAVALGDRRAAPQPEALEQVVAAAGYQLQVGLLPADPKLLELVGEQLELGPTDRLKALLHSDWPACRDALRAAAFVGELAVLVGAVAATLRGSPQPPVTAGSIC